jgi:hypothetical protein
MSEINEEEFLQSLINKKLSDKEFHEEYFKFLYENFTIDIDSHLEDKRYKDF